MKKPKATSAYEDFLESSRQRRVSALKMNEDGMSFAKIGDELGVSPQRAFSIVTKARREAGKPKRA